MADEQIIYLSPEEECQCKYGNYPRGTKLPIETALPFGDIS